MKVFDLLRKESNKDTYRLSLIGGVAGVSNALLLIIINKAAENDASGASNTFLFLAGLVCVILYLLTQRFVQQKTLVIVLGIVNKVRVRIINKLRLSELQTVEELGKSEVYARITNDTQTIANATATIAATGQSVIMVLFAFIYLGFMSMVALGVIVVCTALAVYNFFRTKKKSADLFVEASVKDTQFFESLTGVLTGFKEIKINRPKNNGVFRAFRNISKDSSGYRLKASLAMLNFQIIGEGLFYLMLMIVIFVIPAFKSDPDPDIVKISAGILFIIGPIKAVVTAIPLVIEANNAAENIYRLEARIENELDDEVVTEDVVDPETGEIKPDEKKYPPMILESEIRLENLEFEYPRRYDSDGFKVGPISLAIPKGQLTFITGGNGSGKSTMLKLLCGLYYPQKGSIKIDDTRVTKDNYQNYRESLAVIFTDFHLFDRLYGLSEVNQKKVNDLLKQMQISEKTQIIDGRITDMDLSTGQRKRLALAIALLEDKAIYVFDEVAADQDPTFKKYFYTELLPLMKKEGKTVVVVSHDDQYFDRADCWYKLLDGKLISTDANGTHV